jgi:hypothetical protein
MQPRLLLYKGSKRRSLPPLLLAVLIFTSSCDRSLHAELKLNLDRLIVRSLPVFPAPSDRAIDELEDVCPENKCIALHEWLARLVVLEKQLALYEDEFIEK